MALALLAVGEQAPAAFPVRVSIEARADQLSVTVDGQTHSLTSALGGEWQAVMLEQPGPLGREYQVDGSDTTSTNDRDPAVIRTLLGTPLYAVDAFLRDEGSYSRWEHLTITDLDTQSAVAPNALPTNFRVDADLRRPEGLARIWLVGATLDAREGLELDRDQRNARWVIERGGTTQALPRWFFPEQTAPFAAELLWLIGRGAAAAYLLVLLGVALVALAHCTRRLLLKAGQSSLPPVGSSTSNPGGGTSASAGGRADLVVSVAALAAWLAAAALVSARVYNQLPHILDAVSYTYQAGLFASGELAQLTPPLAEAFKGPFEVVWQGHIFSQYPPGAPAMYALGAAVGLEWLAGPLACGVLIAATTWTARTLHGAAAGWVVLGLGVLSPFIIFQAGSYLSHPIAAGLLAVALAAFVAAECDARRATIWYAVCGAMLGAAFCAREVAAVLFALPLAVRLIASRRWDGLGRVVAFGLPFLLAYLLYNARQTGSPLLLPRALFDPSDHFGFGDGIGFHTRHTLAAGLANTDELLTLLQFDLFGWPPLFLFGLISVPFLFGRARTWDFMAAGGFLAFVAAYVAYFYHGIALGPRYYFEAMPWLLLLAARGAQVLAQLVGSRPVVGVVLGVLALNTLFFYLPAELARRADFSGLPDGSRLALAFVEPGLFGPRVVGVPDGTLVLTDDWWVYNTALAALNCPAEPDCPVLFGLAPNAAEVDRLRAQFPDRTLVRAVENDGTITVVPYG